MPQASSVENTGDLIPKPGPGRNALQRGYGRGAGNNHRIIRDPDGAVVLQDAGYDGEMGWIKASLEDGSP